jgi:streptogramin lyase
MVRYGFGFLAMTLVFYGAGCSASQIPARSGVSPTSAVRQFTRTARAKFVEYTNGISPYAGPRGIISGTNVIWFTEPGDDKIAKISSSGVVKEFPVTAGTAPNNIAYGSDRALWYTEATDAIGRMTAGGRVKDYSVGNASSGPWDIALGTDGNMWFTLRSPISSSYYNAIGRITTSGAVTLYTAGLSAGDIAVHDIALGPDGNMWFTEEYGNRVGSITPGGTITEYSTGISPYSVPVDVTAGPDGNVWFTESNAGNVARITTAGTVTEFPLGATPGAITAFGSYVWVCESSPDQLARVDMSGNVTNYSIPGQSCSQDTGLKKNLWITDSKGNGVIKGSRL